MATSQAASSGTAAAVGGTANPVRETVVGTHMMKIDGFSGTKDLGVGKSIKSSTFNVGGHGWYIECYPCGDDELSAGWVSLFLCLSDHKEQVDAECNFYTPVRDDDGDLYNRFLGGYCAESSWRMGGKVSKREELESLLKDNCFPIRCEVYICREFPTVPPPDMHLHRPLSDLLAGGMTGDLTTFHVDGELFTLHRGLPGPSTKVAASATSAAGATTTVAISSDNVSGSHVLTIEGYSQAKNAFCSEDFRVGGHSWNLELYPNGEKVEGNDCLPIFLVINGFPTAAVKVRFELTLLTMAREVISSIQSCYAFTNTNVRSRCYLPFNMEPELSPFQDSFHVKCDVTVVEEITPLRPPGLHRNFSDLLASQVGTDVEFEVGGVLFSAHKLVLATRSSAFMAKFFGPAGNGSSTNVTRVRIDDMEPRVFKALVQFIYTDALPQVQNEEDKVVMAQGLLVAADQYGMERLKLMCSDMLCNYVKDAGMAVDTLELADKRGCRRLKEKCMKILKGHFAKVAR